MKVDAHEGCEQDGLQARHRLAVLMRLRKRGRPKGGPLPQKKQQRMYRGSAVRRQAGFNPGGPGSLREQA
jgi:hypothetical protein